MFIDAQRIAIIGMGSRGLSVLEQLIGAARRVPHTPLMIDLFDPQLPGSGLHLPEQPDYLMLNTMAGQLSGFSSAYPAWEPDEAPGMTFLQWCAAEGLRLDERGHVSVSGVGRAIEFADFVPRKLLGRYLRDCYRHLLTLCPAYVQVKHRRGRVIGCRPNPDDQGFHLHTADGLNLETDAVFLTTGHAPQPDTNCDAKRVAIEGLGLSAMDQIAHLTEGRGGRFVRDDSQIAWRYQPSGREPQIYLFSRSGLPFHCRPQGRPRDLVTQRLFFTEQAIVELRKNTPDGRLDFAEQILPLIEDEMRAVFYMAKVRLLQPEQLERVSQSLQSARTEQAVRDVFASLAEELGPFEPRDYLSIRSWQGDPQRYSQWFRQWIACDLARGCLGVDASPLTQAMEVWRDCRDLLRLAADHDGLNDRSTLEFYGALAGLGNRLVGGPQKERYEDLLALLDAGVVMPLAPGSIHAIEIDGLINARNAHSGLSQSRSPLINDMLAQGLIKAAHPYPADGIAVDSQSRALRRDGSTHARLWVLGPGVEGCTFYNHYVPTPDPACKAPLQARIAVQACLAALHAEVENLAVY
ncbi:FAD/NAD(P)-binding protein [Pseudomonas syringae]|nr:FAD/NAD(P)-binding protein [Pseudomonas syringae]